MFMIINFHSGYKFFIKVGIVDLLSLRQWNQFDVVVRVNNWAIRDRRAFASTYCATDACAYRHTDRPTDRCSHGCTYGCTYGCSERRPNGRSDGCAHGFAYRCAYSGADGCTD